MTQSGVRIEDRDSGYKALVARVFEFGKPSIEVGILTDEPKKSDEEAAAAAATLLEVAIYNEFGVEGHIPPRSFIRAWFDESEPKLREQLTKLMQAVVDGKRGKDEILELLGQVAQGEIQARISAGIPPENADATVERKSSSTPLIDTGQLRSAVTYKVNP